MHALMAQKYTWYNHVMPVVTVLHAFSDYCLQLVARARDEAASYREFYGHPIPGKVLAERVAGFVHAYTMYWSVRPFGASILIVTMDDKTPSIWMVEPSGLTYSYNGCAIGKGKQVWMHAHKVLSCVNMFV
jgi:20S proteasome alpha/beta subunit